jgi:hypothetical protein
MGGEVVSMAVCGVVEGWSWVVGGFAEVNKTSRSGDVGTDSSLPWRLGRRSIRALGLYLI